MKHRKNLILITFLLVSISLFGQEMKQNIRGNIVDSDSKIAIFGANIIIVESDPLQGTSTDINGDFTIENVKVGRVNLKVSAIGYENIYLNNIMVESARETILKIQLIESYELLETVTITNNEENGEIINNMAMVSAKSVTVEETGRYAGALNDPARMVSAFAGVSGDAEGNNDIVVRGNSPRGLLWRLEGIEIPNPNHFAESGSSGGPVNTLNATMLSTSDFFSGAFEPTYGNALSGVFDTYFRTGNNQNREYTFSVGLLGVDITLEGPFSKNSNSSYLVNYRYSTLDLLDGLGLIDFGGIPKYQDASFKVMIPTKKAGVFSVFGLGGISSINENDIDEETQEIYENAVVNAKLGVIGLKHHYMLSRKMYLQSYVAASGNSNGIDYNKKEENSSNLYPYYNQDFNESNIRISTSLNTKFNVKNTLKAGFIYSFLFYTMKAKENVDNTSPKVIISSKGETSSIQAFSSWKHRFTEKLTMVTGLHYTLLTLNNNYSIEPRIAFNWQLNPKQGFSLGIGLHSRMENISIYNANVNDIPNNNLNKDLGFSKAAHFVIGFSHSFTKNLLLTSEVYYQHLYNVPIENYPNSSFSMLNVNGGYINVPLVNDGSGKNYGIELTLERFYAKQFYYMITASIYESKYTAMDEIERNTRYNANYAFNLVLGKEFNLRGRKNNKTLAVNVKASLIGGGRYTLIDLEESILKNEEAYIEEKYSHKSDAFGYINLGITYRVNRPKVTHEIKLDIQNLTNSQSIVGYSYNERTQLIEENYQLSMIPNLMYVISF